MKKRIYREFLKLNESEKIFVLCEIFVFWSSKDIFNEKEIFTPESVGVNNKNDVIKVLKYLSKSTENYKTRKFISCFKNVSFEEKIDFLIFMFEYMSDNDNIITNINDKMSFKDLSKEILKYKLFL